MILLDICSPHWLALISHYNIYESIAMHDYQKKTVQGVLEHLKPGAPKSFWSITSANFHFQSSHVTWKLQPGASRLRQSSHHPIHFADCGARDQKSDPVVSRWLMRIATYICWYLLCPHETLTELEKETHGLNGLVPNKIFDIVTAIDPGGDFSVWVHLCLSALSSKDSPAGLHGSFRADLLIIRSMDNQ